MSAEDLAGHTSAPDVHPPRAAGIDRFTWLVAVGSVALILVGVGLAMVLGRGEPAIDLDTPGGVTLAYELAIQRGEADAAWELLSSSARAGTTRQEFLARAAGIGRGADARFSVDNVRVSGDTAHLDLVRVVPSGGFLGLGAGTRTSRDPVTLQREAGQWRISVPPEPFLIMRPAGGREP
jgi:hypothetical protein